MLLSLNLFTALIILGIVGGMISLTAIVMILITEKEVDYLEVEKERAELEVLLNESKLLQLSAQIRPHFLFNTLNTISTLIRLKKNKEAEQAIYSVSSLLRYHLENEEALITLKDEMKYAKQYLSIQKLRFGDRLDWTFVIPEKLMDEKIPMLVIQPLIENACIHGIEPAIEGGRITLSAKAVEDQLQIEIRDDGVGVSDEVIDGFEKWKQGLPSADNHLHIGLKNVHSRLVEQFGRRSGLMIKREGNETVSEVKIFYQK
ncbi:sensor histidine kinase [Siminovitchia acidinfaciens]|uniref:Sensor histidine kinase n=1 Tax=Siminovitchia acidinfaciens TaxID=2321395 RepID=A0A429Y027_9BACI|nr:sensor histidine kinase [Siminovitchia acidinfaciens]RST74329.1 sensor histidine kinase [Siminovitchia acidinfaciens]